MPSLHFEMIAQASLQRVWAIFHDPIRSLPILSPPETRLRIARVDMPIDVGSGMELTATGPFNRTIAWTARMIEYRPPHPVVFGAEARFVDIQELGPFKSWRHEHEFEAIDDNSTRVVDHITYAVGYGPIGWILDRMLVRPTLRAMFDYRHEALAKMLENDD